MIRFARLVPLTFVIVCSPLHAQTLMQPKVASTPGEPDWSDLLRARYGLSMYGDLKNPVTSTAIETPGLFRKAGPGFVKFTPILALGLPTRTRGGWYYPEPTFQLMPKKTNLWSFMFKNSLDDLRTGSNLPPPLDPRAQNVFDPGEHAFGLWIANDQFNDNGIFSQPALVEHFNKRVGNQPYKAMIYPNRDKLTGKDVPNSYVIGWEYSTNDDFQDVVCQIDNVIFLPDKRIPLP